MRTRWIVLSILAWAIVGSALYFGSSATEAEILRQPDREAPWPTDQMWVWSVPTPPERFGSRLRWIGLTARMKSVPLAEKESLGTPGRALARHEAEREFRLRLNVPKGERSRPELRANVQLVDLADMAVAPTTQGSTLRVHMELNQGWVASRLPGSECILPAGRFVGYNTHRPARWKDAELLLLSFWVEDDERRYQYDVLIDATYVHENAPD